ncbi:vesicle-associated protein 2-2-like isoform X2 [Actinidia eriantha]|nr:vesicle-associated protein 2-2-like isoform X2 [Actinidia eriantha]XP_057484851.1 vesicle-associated protein 2-2-like isoform X2 [Actinidia eriantha]XP_057484852.1 vesicle-associated protein 2-2-like isoform X2 [Actinidia eriantha]
MSTQLLDIQPCELKFTFELKTQSSCAVQLHNLSHQYVAFKVKTTSPKKYCVRPNIGIIKPRSKGDFTVTMQAQRSVPSELRCKDKFLIQSTVVPFGTTDEDITPGMFAKDSGKHIEESKLKVVLVSPPHSPILLPVSGVVKQEPFYGIPVQKNKPLGRVENLPPPMVLSKNVEDVKSAPFMEELRPGNDVDLGLSKDTKPRPVKDMEDTKLKLGKDIEAAKSKLKMLESKLAEADFTIARLTEEKRSSIQEKETLEQELGLLRSQSGVRRVKVGFPFLFVCMIALISLTVGYLLHP